MRTLLHEITRESDVGIFGKQTASALIYADKITVREPYAQCTDGNVVLAFRVSCIGNPMAIDHVIADIADDRQGDAWFRINVFLK